jgi:uncharacterized protein with gpF-like domain
MRQDPSRQIRYAFARDLEGILRQARGQAVEQVRDALRKGTLDVDELNRMIARLNDYYLKSKFEDAVRRHTRQAYQFGATWTLAHVDSAPKPPGIPALNISLNLSTADEKAIQNITTLAHHDLKDLNVNLSRNLIRDLAKADKQGAGIVRMAEIVHDRYGVSLGRAKGIARTTVTLAYNTAAHDRITEYAPFEEWIATVTDDRTRESHRKMHHTVIEVGDVFHLPAYTPPGAKKAVPAADVRFPGDDSLGADLAQIINCRCSVGPRFTRRA